MANLVISTQCNLHCPFCFARDYLHQDGAAPDTSFLSMECFEDRLDFLARSEMEEVRLIGGEPTLHPQFPELLIRALQRFPKVVVFTNGLIAEPALSALAAAPVEKISIMVNTSAAHKSGELTGQEQFQRKETVRRLGQRAMLSYTIAASPLACDFLVEFIRETGCRSSIRLGLAQPALLGSNACLHPRDYPAVGEEIACFATRAARWGIRVEFDCGFVRCMFSQASMEALAAANAYTASVCSPVLDIDLDGQASHCFPLAGRFQRSWEPGANGPALQAQDLRQYLEDATRVYRTTGIYPECSSCSIRRAQECSGGCLAQTIQRFQPAAFHIALPRIGIIGT